jgi:AcrR family transcriptional regulator
MRVLLSLNVPGDVKGGEPTRGVREQARTRLARRAVVAAARTLFLERGYAATTIEAISDLADVPQATVYRLFVSKLGILKALLDTSIAGDDEPVSVEERPGVAALFAEPDPDALLAGFAGVATSINQRTNDVYRALVSAAGSDPAASELLDEIDRQRDEGQCQIVSVLVRNGSLREGLPEDEAVDLVHALMSPDLYRLLVVDRHWSAERYQHWLAGTLLQQLT